MRWLNIKLDPEDTFFLNTKKAFVPDMFVFHREFSEDITDMLMDCLDKLREDYIATTNNPRMNGQEEKIQIIKKRASTLLEFAEMEINHEYKLFLIPGSKA